MKEIFKKLDENGLNGIDYHRLNYALIHSMKEYKRYCDMEEEGMIKIFHNLNKFIKGIDGEPILRINFMYPEEEDCED